MAPASFSPSPVEPLVVQNAHSDQVRPDSTIAVAYFVLYGAIALASRSRPGWRRTLALSVAGACVALSAALLRDARTGALLELMGTWGLLVALPLAYWAPAPLVASSSIRLERWLLGIDDRLDWLTSPSRTWPLDRLLELSYLLVYAMVPLGFAVVLASADQATVERFWVVILCAVLPCYGLLPLLPTRPPRALAGKRPRSEDPTPTFRRLNLRFLETFSNGWNTVPSGHAAGAVAVAMLVAQSGSRLAPLVTALAIGIVLGTVRGRYHYVVDTALGVLLGVMCASVL